MGDLIPPDSKSTFLSFWHAVAAPVPVTSYKTETIVDPAISDEVAAHQLARAEALGIQAGGLYAEVFGDDPNQITPKIYHTIL